MSYLVYWYGARKESSVFYSFQKNVISYEEEKAKGHQGAHKHTLKIQMKIEDGLPLNKQEEETVLAYGEMEEDLLKEPQDRKCGVPIFLEGYERLSVKDKIGVDLEDD